MDNGVIKVNKKAMLLITEDCNLNCVYCYEHFKNHAKMDFETAKSILDKFYSKTKSGDTVLIEVFGGEAFTNFPLIKKIDDYVMSMYSDRTNLFETTTNGTLIHGDIQSWLYDRRDRYDISLSLDGTREMHNRNRPFLSGAGSYDRIDIEFFLRTWPDCQAKMTMSKATVDNLAEGIINIHNLGFVCDATLSTGVDFNFKEYESVFVRELGKLVDFYSQNSELKLCTMLNYDLRLVFSKLNKELRFCGAGELTSCFDLHGDEYPCQGFAPVSLGDKARIFKDYDTNKLTLNEENPCVKCKYFFLCANCYSANYCTTGCTHLVDKNLCMAYRLCILASSKIQYNRILAKQHFSDDDRLTLKAISVIQSDIASNPSPICGDNCHVCNSNNRCC